MQVTHKKIADIVGVSRSLVSMALKDAPSIDPKTKAKIKKVADELGYRPNMLIRGIQTGKTMTIGVVLKAQRTFFSNILCGIESYLETNQYMPIILSPHKYRSVGDQINRLLDQRVDGLILKPEVDLTPEDLEIISKVKIPLIMVDNQIVGNNDYSGSDEDILGITAANHFINLGHKRTAIVSVRDQIHLQQRAKSFMETIYKATNIMPIKYELDYFSSTMDFEALINNNKPTAIFFVSDTLAGDFINYAHDKNINVPKEISVMGAGNMELGLYTYPKLTTIDQDPFQMGEAAARILLSKINSKEENQTVICKTKPSLLMRESTCICRSE